MNPLLSAVLDHRHDELRELCRSDRHLLHAFSESKRLPLDIAAASGDIVSTTILLREGAPSTRPVIVEFRELSRYLLLFQSRLMHWPEQYEFQLWKYVVSGELVEPPPRFPEYQRNPPLHPETRSDVRFLAERIQRWATPVRIHHGYPYLAPVTLVQWEAMYAEWSATH